MKNQVWPWLVRLSLATSVALYGAGCAPDVAELTRHGDRPSAGDINRRLREMQRIQLPGGITVDASQLDTHVKSYCLATVQGEAANNSPLRGCAVKDYGGGGTCGDAACGAQLHLCAAAVLLDVADTPRSMTVGGITIPPQRRAANAAIREYAVVHARDATLIAGNALRRSIVAPGADGICVASALDSMSGAGDLSVGELLSEAFVEGARMSHSAVEDAAADTLAVAETLPSTMGSYATGHWAQWYGERLSFAHASRLYVPIAGPADDFESSMPPCSSWGADLDPQLSDWALDLLRNGGFRPDILGDLSISVEDLWDGSGLADPGGLRDRFGQRTGVPIWATMTLREFQRSTGVGLPELTIARRRIAEEAVAFSAAPTRTYTPQLLGISDTSGGPVPLNYYASTARPAVQRNVALVGRLSSGQMGSAAHGLVTTEGSDGRRPTRGYARTSQASFVDWVATVSSELVASMPSSDPLRSTIAQAAASWHGLRSGRLTVQYSQAVDPNNGVQREATLALFGNYSTSEIRVVAGSDQAACAIDGQLDGEPCTFDALQVQNLSAQVGVPSQGYRSFSEFSIVDVPDEPLYLLRRRDGAIGSGSGNFELVQTVELDWPAASGHSLVATYPIVPFAQTIAQQLLSPSPTSCDQNEVSCTGLLRNSRLPLENQLSEDGDAYESSWRHYLALARIAAQNADDLGQQLIDAGERIDDRSERAWDELEAECGDVGTLANGIDVLAPGGACTGDTDCQLANGERCVNGTCLTLPGARVGALAMTDPRAARVSECLGLDDQSVIPLATLGSRPLCMWRNSAGEYCTPFEGAPRCPYERADAPADEMQPCATLPRGGQLTLSTGLEFVEVRDTLGVSRGQFDQYDTGDAEDLRETCDAIRDGWGDRGASDDDIRRLIRGRFEFHKLAALATRIGWVAEPMNLSHLTLDRSPWVPRGLEGASGARSAPAATGRIRDGIGGMGTAVANVGWPCQSTPIGVSCSGERSRSLFCQTVDCSGPSYLEAHQNRARINDRMARAVLALHVGTGVSMGSSRSPFWSDAPAANWFTGTPTDIDSIANVHVGDGTPVVSMLRYSHVRQGTDCGFFGCAGTRVFYGDAYCFSTCEGGDCPPVWSTRLRDDDWAHLREAGCVAANVGHGDQVFVTFDPRRHSGIDFSLGWGGVRTSDVAPTIWAGVTGGTYSGSDAALDTRPEAPTRDLLIRVLRGDLPHETVVLDPRTRLSDFTRWWDINNQNLAAIGGAHQRIHAPDGEFASGLTAGNFLDALELVCEVERSGATECDPTSPPPEASSIRELAAVRAHFRCVASQIENTLDHAVIPNVPAAAVRRRSAVREGSRVEQGAYGAAVLRYGAALDDLSANLPEVARELRAIDRDIEQLEILVQQVENQEQLRILSLVSAASRNAAACASGIAGAVESTGGGVLGAVASCADAAAQVAIAIVSAEVAGESDGLRLQSEIIALNQRFDDRMGRMATIARQIRAAVAELQAASVELTTRRSAAGRALARATLADDAGNGRLLYTNTVLRRRYSTTRTRYRRAFEHAQRMAYLARIAIEQQVGMDLSSLQEDMTLVPRPSSWADTICSATGIDYGRVRDVRDREFEDFADQYVGEYVGLLERFVESYRIDHSFQDGRDTMVVSLREDVFGSSAMCLAEQGNLLYGTGDLDADEVRATTGEDRALWQVEGCAAPQEGEPMGPCVSRARLTLGPDEGPFWDQQSHFGERTVFAITFNPDVGDAELASRYTPDVRIVQRVRLAAGRYRLSWYSPTPDASAALHAESGGLQRSVGTGSVPGAGVWVRYFYLLELLREEDVAIAWVPLTAAATGPHGYVVAGPMLERVEGRIEGPVAGITSEALNDRYRPAAYAETGLHGERMLPVCPDLNGRVFRSSAWNRRCQELCPGGFDMSCEGGQTYCYYETTFDVDAKKLLRGEVFGRGPGLARGNYNYRIDALGVNFVGSASRECRGLGSPETCYSSGWIHYTLLHGGSHAVVDHYGSTDYVAPINLGRMEGVRGLAAERYLTNPISSADQALMGEYMHRHLRGRPLPGRYVLRVWDGPGVNFEGVQDVQVVLRYSYWTRQR